MANEKDSIHARFEAGQDVMQVAQQTGMTLADAGWRYCVWLNEASREMANNQDAEVQRLREQVADLEKLNRWQAESLAAFRGKFGAKSNCEALDGIDALREQLDSEHRADVEINETVGKYMADNERLREQVRVLRDALEEARKFAIYGCGEKQKDVRGIQFSTIADLTMAALAQTEPRP